MAHPEYIRQKAVNLRIEKGLTIDELAECLALPKTTIYYWVKDIEIARKPGQGWPSDAQKKGTAAMQAKYRRLREEGYEEGVRMYPDQVK